MDTLKVTYEQTTKRNLYMDKGITGTASKFVYGAVSDIHHY